jgi:hypothetical protein
MHTRQRGELFGHADAEETHEITYANDLPPMRKLCNGNLHNAIYVETGILSYTKFFLIMSHWTRLFNARRTHLLKGSYTRKSYYNGIYPHKIPAKLSRNTKQDSSSSTHLMRRIVLYLVKRYKAISRLRVPRVGRVWWHNHGPQVLQTPPSK